MDHTQLGWPWGICWTRSRWTGGSKNRSYWLSSGRIRPELN